MNRNIARRFTLTVVAALISPLSVAGAPAFGEGPNPPPHVDHRKVPYLDMIAIVVASDVEPVRGKPLPSGIVDEFSRLAGVKLKYIRNGGGYHLLKLPKKGYEADGEANCKKILVDARVKECSPEYMFFLESATASNDPIYTNGQQWNLRNESPAGIDAVTAWKITPGTPFPYLPVPVPDNASVVEPANETQGEQL